MTASPRTFAVTWDYRCPFARNAHEHVVTGLRSGAPWDVRFVAFSLGQVHVAEGEPDIWEHPQDDTGLLALQAGVVVRDSFPDKFLDAHEALFALRHDRGGQLRDAGALREALTDVGVDADAVFAEIATGDPLVTVRQEHEWAVKEHAVFGVPTFIVDDRAAFVRLMDRPGEDAARATEAVEGVVRLVVDDLHLNELKHTSIPR
jgi:hypothetical protein